MDGDDGLSVPSSEADGCATPEAPFAPNEAASDLPAKYDSHELQYFKSIARYVQEPRPLP